MYGIDLRRRAEAVPRAGTGYQCRDPYYYDPEPELQGLQRCPRPGPDRGCRESDRNKDRLRCKVRRALNVTH